jgi:hypothetical protein
MLLIQVRSLRSQLECWNTGTMEQWVLEKWVIDKIYFGRTAKKATNNKIP